MKNIFKVLLSLLLVAVMTVSFVSCSDENKTEKTEEVDEKTQNKDNKGEVPSGNTIGGTPDNKGTNNDENIKVRAGKIADEICSKCKDLSNEDKESIEKLLRTYLIAYENFENLPENLPDGCKSIEGIELKDKEAFWKQVYFSEGNIDETAKEYILNCWKSKDGKNYPARKLEFEVCYAEKNEITCDVSVKVPDVNMTEVENDLNSEIESKSKDDKFMEEIAAEVKKDSQYKENADDETVKKLINEKIEEKLLKSLNKKLEEEFNGAKDRTHGKPVTITISKKDDKWVIENKADKAGSKDNKESAPPDSGKEN